MKVYDLAKELGIETIKVLKDLRREGLDVSVPSNTIPVDVAERIRKKYLPSKDAPEQKARLKKTRPRRLIESFIESLPDWEDKERESYYLKVLVPGLMSGNEQFNTYDKQKGILAELKQLLTSEEWSALPQLIDEQRAGKLRPLEYEDSPQRKARERARLEAARQEALRIEEAEKERLRREAEERERLRREELRDQLLKEIRRKLQVDFLGVEDFFHGSCSDLISREEFEREKTAFVKSWVVENTPPDKTGKRQMPNAEQVAAIAAVHGHFQVIARAGSGKTTTLVNRALFLIKHCGVAAGEMLLLAFNRKAVFDVHRRLLSLLAPASDVEVTADVNRRMKEPGGRKKIDKEEIEASAVEAVAKRLNVTLPHVMTFHALAYAIVHPKETLLYDTAEGDSKLSRSVQEIIDDHLQDPIFKRQIRELMLAHFREDWDRIVEGGYDQSKEQLLQFRRSLPRESLRGEYVKSFGEKVIANFLFEHDVPYKYERSHWWNRINYRPDFTVFRTPASGVIIEYFGLKGEPDYDEMSEKKREYWAAKEGWSLIEFSPSDIREGVETFCERLKSALGERGIVCNRLSEDEIWNRIRNRAIDRFTTAMVGFIGRCRKRSLSPRQLHDLIGSHSMLSPVEGTFIHLARRFYDKYLERLSAVDEEDFDGLLQRAAQSVAGGQTLVERKSGVCDLSLLRHVCIDEFQDFSELFYRLLDAIHRRNPGINFFCVGDDWQAINSFAGSDLRFFQKIDDYIEGSRRLYISTNYRSYKAIVDIGNALMDGLGKRAVAHKQDIGEVLISDLNRFEPSLLEKQRHSGDIITPAVLRLVDRALADDLDVVILCRRNAVPWYVNGQDQVGDGKGLIRYLDLIRSFFPKDVKERIGISTVHKYKGLERSMVIVLDAIARSYPLIHPDWLFFRVLGDNLEKIMQEERRLLYVALTRAIKKLVIITDGRSKSPFLEQLERKYSLDPIDWAEYSPLRDSIARLIVKVGNQAHTRGGGTFAIKEMLSATGYQFQSTPRPEWVKSVIAKGFKVEALKSELWAELADGIEVQILDHTNSPLARYLVDSRKWICDFDKIAQIQVAT
jgi:DNA helicase IV